MKINIFGYTLSLTETVVPKKKHVRVGYSSKPWSNEDTAKLIAMHKDGKSNVGCARMIGRTTNSINAKLWKLRKEGIIDA